MSRDAYREAGVDIDAGDALVERISPLAKHTHRPGVIGGLGGFGGLFALDGRWRDPVMVSGTDGVGTKLLLAQELDRHDTIGIDLVAMCVNDIALSRAEPLTFLDYFATGKLDVGVAARVIAGIAAGCKEAGCALLGGETAEMPGMYAPGHYDLAGFAVGIVERDELPDPTRVRPGHLLVGLPSTGLHSNGYSLVRKVIRDAGLALTDTPAGLSEPLADAVMRPTAIYVSALALLFREFGCLGAAHITGGGLPGNLPRCLPEGLTGKLDRQSWHEPPIFGLLRAAGELDTTSMARAFNLGLGLVAVLPAETAHAAADALGGMVVGAVVEGDEVQLS